ncbi:MAG: ferric reductase-like transmembrane domain-containing protein [Thermoplasmatota archaeon]
MGSWRRWSALLAAAFLAVGATVAVPGGTPTPKAQETTQCWTCHSTFSPPLKHFTNIIPPDHFDAPTAKQTQTLLPTQVDDSIRVNNGYEHEITHTETSMDLRHAPSLAFGAAPKPFSKDLSGLIPVRPPGVTTTIPPTAAPQSDAQALFVPEDAGGVTLCTDAGAAGPRLTLAVFVGNATATPYTYTAAQGGDPVCVPAADAPHIRGNVTARTSFDLPDAADPGYAPPPGGVPYTLHLNVTFGGSRLLQVLASNQLIPKHQNKLFTFRLLDAGKPGDGEYVTLTVNTTVHYQHINPSEPGGDWENITTVLVVPVTDDGQGGAAMLAPTTVVTTVVLQNGATVSRISEAVGYASAFLLIASNWSGGLFGAASRRSLNRLFSGAKRRVAFHNFLSYGLTAAALAHTLLFLLRFTRDYQITLGLIWGSLAILSMFGLGVTGALQIPMIRRWNYETWRVTHYWMGIAAVGFTVIHMLLDGGNFAFFQDWVHWHDPFLPPGGLGVH